MIEETTDKICIFCRNEEVFEMKEYNVHKFHIGYRCEMCKCIWNDETESEVTA